MLQEAQRIGEQLVHWRRDLHMHPELGFEETRTAALVAHELETMGHRVQSQVGRTGVVAQLGTGQPVISIRADSVQRFWPRRRYNSSVERNPLFESVESIL